MQSNDPLILIISAHVLSENILACFWEIVFSERIGFLTSNKARKIFVYIYRILKDPISPTVLSTLEHYTLIVWSRGKHLVLFSRES